ncbi:MAG: hypothetical protein MUE85_04535 [Microscillaceae bacterium]|jgi:hypothetical protein|nr:hypothetical protein [Microscillaceae bacterium]
MLIKPRTSAIYSLVAFLGLAYSFLGLLIYNYVYSRGSGWWYWLGFGFVGGLALVITIRIFYNYKVISVAKGKIIIDKQFLWQKTIFDLSDLLEINEQVINTMGTSYRLLNLRFSQGFVEISEQEYTNYEAFKNYLEKNKPKKKKSSKP